MVDLFSGLWLFVAASTVINIGFNPLVNTPTIDSLPVHVTLI